MKTAIRSTLILLGLGGLALWWLADHRRGIAWAVAVVRRRFPDVSHLPVALLDAWLRDAQRPAPQLVDARSAEEYAVSHLPEALRADPAAGAAAVMESLDPARPVVIYCSAGYRSATLARRLQAAGRREVWNLEGGIFAWANADLPLEVEGATMQRVHPHARIFARLLKPRRVV